MPEKPTYEELEKRVRELEQLEIEREKSKKTLREIEKTLRFFYQNAPIAYQSLDEKGHLIEVNKAWLDTLGYDREEVIGKSFGDFLPPDWKDQSCWRNTGCGIRYDQERRNVNRCVF